MSGEMVKHEAREDNVSRLFQKIAPALEASLPAHCTPERMTRLALNAVRLVPKLAQCNPQSLVGAVMQSAALGLEADGSLGQAYLIPYKNECKLIIGYRGFVNLAFRSGFIKAIDAGTVHEGDEFEYRKGTEQYLSHVELCNDSTWENMTHAYAIAQTTGGGFPFIVIPKDGTNSIASTRSKSAAKSGPWITHPLEMAKKTAIRALFKLLPCSTEMNRALALDDEADRGVKQTLDFDGNLLEAGEDVPEE